MHSQSKFILAGITLLTILFISCDKNPTQTCDCPENTTVEPSDFKGEFTVSLDMLKDTTFKPFESCTLSWSSSDTALLQAITIVTDSKDIIDSALFQSSLTDSQMVLYFLKPYRGPLAFHCAYTNDSLRVVTLDSLSVISPYVISGHNVPQAYDQQVRLSIFNDTDYRDKPHFSTIWYHNSTHIETTTSDMPFYFNTGQTDSHTVQSYMLDDKGNTVLLDSVTINIAGHLPVIDSIIFPDSTLYTGDSLSVMIRLDSVIQDSFEVTIETSWTDIITAQQSTIMISDTNCFVVPVNLQINMRDWVPVGVQITLQNGLAAGAYDSLFVEYREPAPRIVNSDPLPCNDSLTLYVLDTTSRSQRYHWRSDLLNIDTFTETDSLRVFYTQADTGYDNVYITGIDQFDLYSQEKRYSIRIQNYNYTIHLEVPQTVQSGEWVSCVASVDPIPDSAEIDYLWEVQTYGAVVDTQQVGDTLRIRSTIPGTYYIRASAFVNEDTTNVATKALRYGL